MPLETEPRILMNRTLALTLTICTAALLGANCDGPLIDLNENTPADEVQAPREIGAAVIAPSIDRIVPVGAPITIEWTFGNLEGGEAVATVLVRKLDELAESILSGGILIEGRGVTQTLVWDTSGFAVGEYVVIVRVRAGDRDVDARSTGAITLNGAPELDFIEPIADVALEAGEAEDPNGPDPTRTTIVWSAFDPDGDGAAMIGVDPDLDHDNGNEIILDEPMVTNSAEVDRFVWDGTQDSERVEAGFYNVFAILSDGVNDDVIVEGLGRIEVLPEPNAPEPIELAVTEPAEDTDFLSLERTLTIEFTLDEEEDVLVDLKIDEDDDHQNGNERTILAQRLIGTDTTEDRFDWNGNDSDGARVGNGIFRIFLALSRETGTPQIIEAPGLVFRRPTAELPLIALLNPLEDRTVMGGDFVTISWRDDDPAEDAEVRLTIDDDTLPNEAVETGVAELQILASRSASGDGVQDTFQYQVPASLAPDRYTIFAYIDRDGVAPFDHVVASVGEVVIEDPEQN